MSVVLDDMKGVQEEETKEYSFGIAWQSYGRQKVRVPKNFTEEQAREYVEEHWDEIPLPETTVADSFLPDSDEPDFEDADFVIETK